MGLFSVFKEVMGEIVHEGKENYNREGIKFDTHPDPAHTIQEKKESTSVNSSRDMLKPFSVNILGETLRIVDVVSGGIMRTHALPPGKYSNVVVSGDTVTVTIEYKHYGVKYRTINARTGAIISENY